MNTEDGTPIPVKIQDEFGPIEGKGLGGSLDTYRQNAAYSQAFVEPS